MSEYIKRDKALYELHLDHRDVIYIDKQAAAERIRKIPSVEIVRCADCTYKRLYDGETKYYYCALEDRPNRQWSIDETDYCSWGEREGE